MKPVLLFDMEVYPNYTLLYFKYAGMNGGSSFLYFESPLTPAHLEEIRALLCRHTVVTFNGTGYDIPLLFYCLCGHTAAEVHAVSDRIVLQNLKPWNFEKQYGISINDPNLDHIDLMEVAPLTGSLKIYGGRLHARSLQDMPIPPGTLIQDDQKEAIRQYCANDLLLTESLFEALREQLKLREEMSARYRVDLRSKSDAQIAEAVIKTEIERRTGRSLQKAEHAANAFRYQIPSWIQFRSLPILDDIQKAVFMVGNKGSVVMPKELSAKKIVLGSGVYRMGIGGLHSSETCQAVRADRDHVIMDFDVASYYPAILLNQELYPSRIGVQFLHVYRTIVQQRLAAKKAGQKTIAESLKICVNGTFGKLGSRWSVLYSPDLMIQVTVTGQLALLMLIEAFWAIPGCTVISANTDGVTVKCPKALQPLVLEAADTWELITSFTLERADYDALYSRDVNNYIAVKTNGEVKVKGVYGKGLPLQKNPTAHICATAAIDYLTLGADIEGTIRACRDVRQFLSVRNVKGGAQFEGTDLGRVVRWYYGTETKDPFRYKINNYIVPKTEGARPMMVIPKGNMIPEDLDYSWYVQEAEGMVREVGEVLV